MSDTGQPGDDRWGFDDWARTYDQDVSRAAATDDWMFEDYERVLDTVATSCEVSGGSGGALLEIGAGTGNLTRRLVEKGLRVTAVEPSPEMRRMFHQKLADTEIRDGDFLRIPASDESQDVIASSYAYHHLTPQQKEASIGEMKRVLRPKGRIVIADLMFQDQADRERVTATLRESGRADVADELSDEYPALVDELEKSLRAAGLTFRSQRLTEAVWLVLAQLQPTRV